MNSGENDTGEEPPVTASVSWDAAGVAGDGGAVSANSEGGVGTMSDQEGEEIKIEEEEEEKQASTATTPSFKNPAGSSTTSQQSQALRHARSTDDYDAKSDSTGPNFVDHFSLRQPSSTVIFRGARCHVYDTSTEQFVLEDRRRRADDAAAQGDSNVHRDEADDDDDDDGSPLAKRQHRHTITVRRQPWAGFGLRVLRALYTLVALLLVGFCFVLCFQIILFIFLNIPVESGATSVEGSGLRPVQIIGILLSVPVFLYSMASLMAIGTTFAYDAWNGGILLKSVLALSPIVCELVYFTFFLIVPALTAIIVLMAGRLNPWELVCYAWCLSILFVFCIFGLCVVYRELQACSELIAIHRGDDEEKDKDVTSPSWKRALLLAKKAVLLTKTKSLSGHLEERYFVSGEDEPPEGGYHFSPHHDPLRTKRSLYTRLTELGCLGSMYDKLDPPVRLYTVEEVRDLLPFITTHNWSLEAMCCRHHSARAITAARGPSALTPWQVKASVVCNLFGAVLMTLFIIGLLIWFQAGTVFYVVAAIICVLCCILPMARSSRSAYTMYQGINEESEDMYGLADEEAAAAAADDAEEAAENEEGVDEDAVPEPAEARKTADKREKTTMFNLWETVRVSKPKPWLCYTAVFLEVVFLFVWPLAALFYNKNYPVGAVFLIVGIFTGLRRYLNPSAVLSELGSMSAVNIEKEPGRRGNGPDRTLVLKSRLSEIIGNVTKSAAVHRWMWFFGVLVLVCFLLFLSAVGSDDVQPSERPPIVLTDGFEYSGEDSLQYPTCEMSKGFKMPDESGESNTALGDYAFMSALAYEMTNVTDYILPQWFGEGAVVDEDEYVASWRLASGTDDNPIYFKFFTFPEYPDFGVVAIRGSQTSWDWLVNMQLWSAAGLAQVVKWLTPYGWIWHPILDELVYFVDWIQGVTLKKVSYYTVTTAFIEDTLAGFRGSTYGKLRVTGASLGGGLAIITGAQTGASAVAISGLGAEYSRHTLNPPVTMAQIHEHAFNFIPDRDYIARIGGRPRQHQEGQCLAETSNLFGCHSMWRSVCEINYRCGSHGRPIPCRCVEKFGYPKPTSLGGNKTFEDACAEAELVFLDATGSTTTS